MEVDAGDLTLRLPPETVALVIGFLELPELIKSSLVCKRWRETAFAHRNYWSEIEVTEAQAKTDASIAAAIELAVAQLTRSTAHPVIVNICLRKTPATIDSLLRALADNLHRVNDLIVALDKDLQLPVYEALARPAPLMETLAVELHGAEPSTTLPTNFLGGHAPRLNHLILRNIQLPAEPMAHLTHVPELALVSLQAKTQDIPPQSLNFPSHIFGHFNNLVQLEINAYPWFAVPDSADPLMAQGLARLQRMHLWNSPPIRFLEWPEVHNISKISIYEPDHHILPYLVAHLPGELALSTDHVAGHQFLTVMTALTALNFMPERRKIPDGIGVPATPVSFPGLHLRKFLFDREECALNSVVVAQLRLGGLYTRLGMIAIPAFYLPGVLMNMRAVQLPALREIVVRTRGDLFDIPGGGFLELPALERIVLESGLGASSDPKQAPWIDHEAEDVFELLQLIVPPANLGKFELELYRVNVVNMTEELWATGVVSRMFFTPGTNPGGINWGDKSMISWNVANYVERSEQEAIIGQRT